MRFLPVFICKQNIRIRKPYTLGTSSEFILYCYHISSTHKTIHCLNCSLIVVYRDIVDISILNINNSDSLISMQSNTTSKIKHANGFRLICTAIQRQSSYKNDNYAKIKHVHGFVLCTFTEKDTVHVLYGNFMSSFKTPNFLKVNHFF